MAYWKRSKAVFVRVDLLLLYERGRISLTAYFAGGCLMKCGAVLPAVPGCLPLAVIVYLAAFCRRSLAVFFSCRFYLYLLTFLALHGRYIAVTCLPFPVACHKTTITTARTTLNFKCPLPQVYPHSVALALVWHCLLLLCHVTSRDIIFLLGTKCPFSLAIKGGGAPNFARPPGW